MSSANGYNLQVTTSIGTFTLAASWAAPFFAVDTSVCCKEGDKPLLYHASSFQDASRFGGDIFNATFERVTA
jgi:hypothetical protein